MIDLLQKITNKLDSLQIPYMITGSIAMGFYATQRSTKDIDLLVEMLPKDVNRFVEAFEAEFYCYTPSVTEAVKQQSLFNLIDNETGFKIDFIPLQQSNEFEMKKFQERVLIQIYDKHCWAISAENLIISKIIWIQDLVSEKQLSDIENLLLIPGLDKEGIRDWITKLQLNIYHLKI